MVSVFTFFFIQLFPSLVYFKYGVGNEFLKTFLQVFQYKELAKCCLKHI